MLFDVSPVLQRTVAPGVMFVAVSTDVPLQLFDTVTTGAGGALLGDAIPLPEGLVQPLTVCVTEYVPADVTVMLFDISPVLQRIIAPVIRFVAVSTEVPLQLSVTFTTGTGGVLCGDAVPLPEGLVQPFTVCATE
jgi:hypothetical protein